VREGHVATRRKDTPADLIELQTVARHRVTIGVPGRAATRRRHFSTGWCTSVLGCPFHREEGCGIKDGGMTTKEEHGPLFISQDTKLLEELGLSARFRENIQISTIQ
jgi:hypothetical protein